MSAKGPNADETVSPHALEQHTPEHKRQGIGLCLSGGGFRAALFHLGGLRRLNELNLLGQIATISSVSGGSIVSAHLATVIPWPLHEPLTNWEERVARPFRAFTSRNIRTTPMLRRLLPQNWFRTSTAVEAVAGIYQAWLTNMKLQNLPLKPHSVL
jgi:NTE family protein